MSKSRMSTSNLSYECWAADVCVIASSTIGFLDELKFQKFSISLSGLEEWLWLAGIHIEHTENSFQVHYEAPKDLDFWFGLKHLRLSYDCAFHRYKTRSDIFEAKQLAELQYEDETLMSVDDVIARHNALLDFLKLLAGTSGDIKWPVAQIHPDVDCQIYFTRFAARHVPFDRRECWVTFKQIEASLGSTFFKYLDKKEVLGPTFNNYLGTKFGPMVYSEHLFVSLIWGLEGLHRGRPSSNAPNAALKAKHDRIIKEVSKKSDKKWLANVLKRNLEPTLENRLNDLFLSLPIEIDKAKARHFAKQCAYDRNLLSHFGGVAKVEDYRSFVVALSDKARALSILYHALLLIEIGVEVEVIKNYIQDGQNASVISLFLSKYGLVPHPHPPVENEASHSTR